MQAAGAGRGGGQAGGKKAGEFSTSLWKTSARYGAYSTPVTVRRMGLAASSTVNRTVKPAKPMA